MGDDGGTISAQIGRRFATYRRCLGTDTEVVSSYSRRDTSDNANDLSRLIRSTRGLATKADDDPPCAHMMRPLSRMVYESEMRHSGGDLNEFPFERISG